MKAQGRVDLSHVSCHEISAQADHCGSPHTFVRPHLAPNDAAVEGRFLLRRLKSGIVLHATETRDLYELTTQHVTGPDLTIFVVLDGLVDFSVEDRPFIAADRRSRFPNADCSALMRTEQATVTRRGHKGDRTRKVAVSVDGEWLEEMARGSGGPRVRQFTTLHLAHASWRASAHVLALAEQILNPPDLHPLLRDLYVESRSIEIVADALATIGDGAPSLSEGALASRDALKARTARDYMEANLDRPLSLADIARESGLSVTSLQRKFKTAYGTTVVEFLRIRKLERARDALEKGLVSVSEAAYSAGYSNPANFTTAFRRAFGMQPRAVRR